jgi:hypothetical protein
MVDISIICNNCNIIPVILTYGIIGSTLSIAIYTIMNSSFFKMYKIFKSEFYKWVNLTLYASIAFIGSIISTSFYLMGIITIDLTLLLLSIAIFIILIQIGVILINSKKIEIALKTGQFDP